MEPVIRRAIQGLNWSGLRNVQVRGVLPASGVVWAANHHSWWDGFASAGALWRGGRRPTLLMDAANLDRFGYLRRVGVIGTDELRTATRALRSGAVMIVFPEGELRAPGTLGPLHRGGAWLAVRSGTPLVPVATRAALRAHAAPEYLIDVGPVLEGDDAGELTERLTAELSARLAALDELVATTDPYLALPGFRLAHRGRRDWDERFGGAVVRT